MNILETALFTSAQSGSKSPRPRVEIIEQDVRGIAGRIQLTSFSVPYDDFGGPTPPQLGLGPLASLLGSNVAVVVWSCLHWEMGL